MAFLVVKYIHILAAIVAIGLNISYAVWIIRAQRDPAHMSFALKGIKFLDDRIANPRLRPAAAEWDLDGVPGAVPHHHLMDRCRAGPLRGPRCPRHQPVHADPAESDQAR